jgi:hypothetical protein
MWLVEMAVLSLCVDLMFPYVPLAAADSQPYGNVLVMIIVTFSPSSVFFFFLKKTIWFTCGLHFKFAHE